MNKSSFRKSPLNLKNILFFLPILLAFSVACETPDDNKLEKVRACVDSASRKSLADAASAASDASNCETMANSSNLATKEMTQIKFGIVLLKEQKMAQIASMASGLSSKTAGNHDGFNTALNIMVFTAGTDPTTDANNIQSYGNTLGGAAQTLGNLIQMATTLNGFLSFGNSADTASTSLTTCAASCLPAQKQAIADSALGMQASACSAPADQNSTDPNNMCFKMKAALAGANTSNPASVVQALATYANTAH